MTRGRLADQSLVDKIIISQESFGDFVNAICPSAYLSMTHVNFNALDQLSIKPLGLYGSKEEIVRYIKDLDIINDATYGLVLSVPVCRALTFRAIGPSSCARARMTCPPPKRCVRVCTSYVTHPGRRSTLSSGHKMPLGMTTRSPRLCATE